MRITSCRQPTPDSRAAADVQKAMAYLFKGILPPQLPLVPTIELRLSDGQRKEKALAREVCTAL